MRQSQLVLLPGWGMEQTVFQPLVKPLSELFTISTVDWRNITTANDITERATAAILSTQQPVMLLGWSLGVLVALEAAYMYPQLVTGLILISGTSRFTSSEQYLSGWHPRIVERMKLQLQRNKNVTLTAFYETMFSESDRKTGFHQQFLEMTQRTFYEDTALSLATGLDYLLQTDVRACLAKLEMPCLLLHGQEDTICPPSASYFIREQLGDKATLHIIEKTGHAPFITKQEECLQFITTFIQKEGL